MALIKIWMRSEAVSLVGNLYPPYEKCFIKCDEKKHWGEWCCTAKKLSPTLKLKARLLRTEALTPKMMAKRSCGTSIVRNHGIQMRPVGNFMVNKQARSLSPNVIVRPIKPQVKSLSNPLPTRKQFLHQGVVRASVQIISIFKIVLNSILFFSS